jgi:hypothetical protein
LVYGLEGAAAVVAETSSDEPNRVRFPGVFPDVDLELMSIPEGVKDELILHSAEVPDRFVFPLTGTTFTPRVDVETGELTWLDADGDAALVSPPGWMKEAEVLPGDAAFSEGVAYEIEGEGDDLALVLQLDRAWLDDPDRQFPVVVDPTVQLSSTSPAFLYADTYYRQDSTTNYVNDTALITGRSSYRYHGFLQFGAHNQAAGSMTPGDGVHPIVSSTLTLSQEHSRNCQQSVFIKPVTKVWHLSPSQHVHPSFGPTYDSAHAGYPAALPSTSVCPSGGSLRGPVNFNVTGLVREFENRTRTNYGMALVTSHANDQTYRWFRSSEWTTTSERPKLTVVWQNQTPRMLSPISPANNSTWSTTNKPTQLSLSYADDDGDWGWIEYTLHRIALDGTRTALFTNRRSPSSAVQSGPSPVTLTASQLTPARYEWRARAWDGASYSVDSAWRAFVIQEIAPVQDAIESLPPVVVEDDMATGLWAELSGSGDAQVSPVITSTEGAAEDSADPFLFEDVSAAAPSHLPTGVEILVGDDEVSLRVGESSNLLGAVEAHDREFSVYGSSASETSHAVNVLDQGAQLLTVMAGPSAPRTVKLDVDMPLGWSIEHVDGVYEIRDDVGEFRGVLHQPWAVDADGKPVETYYFGNIQAGSFFQYVDHSSPDIVYPVTSDPKLTFGRSIYLNMRGWEMKIMGAALMATGGMAAAAGCVFGKFAGTAGVIVKAICFSGAPSVWGVFDMIRNFYRTSTIRDNACYQARIFPKPGPYKTVNARNCR